MGLFELKARFGLLGAVKRGIPRRVIFSELSCVENTLEKKSGPARANEQALSVFGHPSPPLVELPRAPLVVRLLCSPSQPVVVHDRRKTPAAPLAKGARVVCLSSGPSQSGRI